MAFRGYFIFESCSFGSATSKTEMYRNVNDSLYYKDRIEYEKTMIHFLLLWEKNPFPINLVVFQLSQNYPQTMGKCPVCEYGTKLELSLVCSEKYFLLWYRWEIFTYDACKKKEKKEKIKGVDHICSLHVYQNEKLCQI